MLKAIKTKFLCTRLSFWLVFLYVKLLQKARKLVHWRPNNDIHIPSYSSLRDYTPNTLKPSVDKNTLRGASFITDLFAATFNVFNPNILHLRWLDKYNNVQKASVAIYTYLNGTGPKFGCFMHGMHFRSQATMSKLLGIVMRSYDGYKLLSYGTPW